MVVVPGLSESLCAVGKRIIRFDITETLLSVEATSSVRRANCPRCSRGSSRRHGQYWRQLRAQPCMGRSVILYVQVRRFKCLNPQCPQATFVEPIEDLAPAKHRRTVGFSGASCAIAQALGGSAAARLSAARYEEVVRLRAQGLTFKAIGRVTELDQRTVKNFVRAGEYPERSPRGSGPMLLDAYRHHLCRRVAEGGTNITTVWQDLRAQGFTGSRGTVRLAMARAYAVSSSTDPAGRPGRRAPTPSVQRAYAWLVGWDERGNQVPKGAEHRQFVDALCAIEPEIAEASSLACEFLGLIHRRDVDRFDGWLARAQDSKSSELRRFAGGLTADLSAVRAAFQSPWSSGQVEGQINRLKFLKRQMYGRANLDLLRARVLHPN